MCVSEIEKNREHIHMLRLKPEFVETICQVYLEKHKPYKYQKLIQTYATRTVSQTNNNQ